MPKCEFSETQYSFGYISEFINHYIPWTNVFPFFPSTGMEGKKGFGYDAVINHNLYFQFKIPYYITKKNQKTITQWNAHKNAYYRIHINTNGHQFKQLKDLKTPNNEVFYCAPEFNKQNEFQFFFLNRELVDNSALFSITDLPNHLSGQHNMTFKPNDNYGILFSEPIEINKINIKNIFENSNQETLLRDELNRLINLFKIQIDLNFTEGKFLRVFEYIRLELYSKHNIIWIPIMKK